MGINFRGIGNAVLDWGISPAAGLLGAATGGKGRDFLGPVLMTAGGVASGNPMLTSAGVAGLGSAVGAQRDRNAEQAEWSDAEQNARFEYDDKVKRYNAAWDTYERNLAMVRRHLDENPELKASAPKEYLAALDVKRPPAPEFRFQEFRPRSSSPLASFLGTGAQTAAQLWPQTNRNQLPQVPQTTTPPPKPGPFLGSYSR